MEEAQKQYKLSFEQRAAQYLSMGYAQWLEKSREQFVTGMKQWKRSMAVSREFDFMRRTIPVWVQRCLVFSVGSGNWNLTSGLPRAKAAVRALLFGFMTGK